LQCHRVSLPLSTEVAIDRDTSLHHLQRLNRRYTRLLDELICLGVWFRMVSLSICALFFHVQSTSHALAYLPVDALRKDPASHKVHAVLPAQSTVHQTQNHLACTPFGSVYRKFVAFSGNTAGLHADRLIASSAIRVVELHAATAAANPDDRLTWHAQCTPRPTWGSRICASAARHTPAAPCRVPLGVNGQFRRVA
jgi:hypothetical protein